MLIDIVMFLFCLFLFLLVFLLFYFQIINYLLNNFEKDKYFIYILQISENLIKFEKYIKNIKISKNERYI